MFHTDSTGVGTLNSCRIFFKASANCNGTIGKGCNVLRDLTELSLQMKFFHTLQLFKMIHSIKISVIWYQCMMILNDPELSFNIRAKQKCLKLCYCHQDKFSFCLHDEEFFIKKYFYSSKSIACLPAGRL